MCGHTHDMVIYSLFHRNPFRGFAAPGGQNLAFAITLAIAFTTTCTTVQAVIVTREHSVQHIPTSCHMLIPASSTQDNLNPNSNDNPNFQKLINHFLVRTLFLSSKFHGGPLITCRLSCSRTNRQTSWAFVDLVWRNKISGIIVTASTEYKCSYDNAKQSFRAFNAMFGKSLDFIHLYSPNKVALYINEQINKQNRKTLQ